MRMVAPVGFGQECKRARLQEYALEFRRTFVSQREANCGHK